MFEIFRTPPPAPPVQPPAPAGPPLLETVFTQAASSSDYAKGIFREAVEELLGANARFDEVEIRAQSEIDRLTALRDEAVAQRRANCSTIENLRGLLGEDVVSA